MLSDENPYHIDGLLYRVWRAGGLATSPPGTPIIERDPVNERYEK